MNSTSHRLPALLCALLTGLFFWWLSAHKLVLVTDEGVYLDGARRMVAGQVPYRDFFVLTGPGHFWNLALLFRLFGVTLAHARLMLIFDLAVMAGGMFWLAARLSSRLAAALTVFVFLGLLSANSALLTVSHRWDSAAFAFVGILFVWAGLERRKAVLFLAAGAAAGYAAWITPSVLVVPSATALWLLTRREYRGYTLPFAGGVAIISAIAAFALAIQGALVPMVQHLLWSSANYVDVNRVVYGSMNGGYGVLLKDASGLEWITRVIILFFYSLPPLLPLVALGWLFLLRRETRPISLLLWCGVALVVSTYPRWDIDHLTFVSPLFYLLASVFIWRMVPPRVLPATSIIFGLAAFTFFFVAIAGRFGLSSAVTKRGPIIGSRGDLDIVQNILEPIPAGSPVFMYVYLPTLYFFSEGVNPTRYSFMQPGMMNEYDQRSVVADLQRNPPREIINGRMSIQELLRIWPKSDPARLTFPIVDQWLEERYTPDPARRGTIEVWLPKTR